MFLNLVLLAPKTSCIVKRWLLFIFALNLASSSLVQAQISAIPTFENIIPPQELSTVSTTAIIQDKTGYMWIGSTNGLNRFDGREVKKYFFDAKDSLSISDNFVNYNALYEHNGAIWVGTRNGLNKYDPSTGNFKRFQLNSSDGLDGHCDNSVNAILASDSTTLWLGTKAGLCKLNLNTLALESFFHDPSDPNSLSYDGVTSLALDLQHQLWVGTMNGLNRFVPEKGSFERYLHDDEASDIIQIASDIIRLHIEDETLWISTMNVGLVRMHLQTGQITTYTHDPSDSKSIGSNTPTRLLTDGDGLLWVATYGGGLCLFDKNEDDFSCFQHDSNQKSTIIDDLIIDLAEDHEGHIWAATWNGVSKMNRNLGFSSLNFDSKGNQILPTFRVNSVYEDHSAQIWIGSIKNGISKLNPRSSEIEHFQHVPNSLGGISSNEIWSITGNDDAVWIGTANGLNKFDRKSKSFTNFIYTDEDTNSLSDNLIYSVFLDSQDELWATTARRGINKLIDEQKGIFSHFRATTHDDSLSSDSVWPVHQDNADVLWFGTLDGGLNKLDLTTRSFNSYQKSASEFSISSNRVLDITSDKSNNLWLSTSHGLNIFDKRIEHFYAYTEDDGLAYNEVSCVLPDERNRLWIGTRDGLSVFNLEDQSFINFYQNDGLIESTFLAGACIKSQSGQFHFGTTSGLVSFYPDSINITIPTPRLSISEVRINNKIITINPNTTKLNLPYSQNNLSFRASVLAYSNSKKNQLYYRMVGIDDTWVPTDPSNLISFTTLPPNDYIFQVKGENSFGISNDGPLQLEITITPPYWQTWWFRLLSVFCTFAIAIAIYKTRVNFLLAVEREALKAEELRVDVEMLEEANIQTESEKKELENDKRILEQQALKISQQNETLQAKNQELEEKNRLLEKQELVISEQSNEIGEKVFEIDLKNIKIDEQTEKLRALKEQLDNISQDDSDSLDLNEIARALEFSPEHYQAGVSILSYFSTILKQKEPEIIAKVRIEQDGTMVRLVIDHENEDEKEIIEKTLNEYGMVVTGQKDVHEFFDDPNHILELKTKLDIAHVELRAAKRQLETERSNFDSRIKQLEENFDFMKERYTVVSDSLAHTVKDLASNKPRGELQTYALFLASSSELKADREQVEIWVNRENKKLIKKGVFLHLYQWEDSLDAMSQTRLQDEYNKAAESCDIFLSLLATKVGKYTQEEFEVAYNGFLRAGRPRFVYTYFKEVQVSVTNLDMADLVSLNSFKEKLKELGHFYTTYKSSEDLKRQLGHQLDKILEEMF